MFRVVAYKAASKGMLVPRIYEARQDNRDPVANFPLREKGPTQNHSGHLCCRGSEPICPRNSSVSALII